MTTIYFVTAVVGGLLVLLSLLGGSGEGTDADADAGADGDADLDTGGDADVDAHVDVGDHGDLGGHGELTAAGVDSGHGFEKDFHKDLGSDTWIPFLSMRFWTFFFAFFGICGLLLGWATNVGELTRGLSAGASGLVAGLFVSYMMRYLRRTQVHSGTSLAQLVGCEAKVLLPISAASPGKIRIERNGEMIDVVASCDEAEPIPIGADVLIISIEGSEAKVMASAAVLGGPSGTPQLEP